MSATDVRDDLATELVEQRQSVWAFFHDRRFTTLFFVDMWERFSFYGMQALIFLYAVAPLSAGGLGLNAGTAGALFGLYMAGVFIMSLPGGWLADRMLGPRRALAYGAALITLGHVVLAIPVRDTFYLGLALVSAGTGLLKPSLPVMFSELYPRASSSLREAAFSIFYMSIQVSALAAPLVTGALGERMDWHLGFGAAALGMALGLVRLMAGQRHFGPEGMTVPNPLDAIERQRVLRRTGIIAGVLVVVFGADVAAGTFTVEHPLGLLGLAALLSPFLYYRFMMRRPQFTAADRDRLRGYRWVLVPSMLFWMLFSQLGSTFVLFAREHTDRWIGGWQVPASWFQSLHPLFLLLVAPISAWLWVHLGERAGAPAKLTAGLLTSGLGFVVIAIAAIAAAGGVLVTPWWLVVAFLAQACGEVTFGPIGLSATAEIAPKGYEGQLVGLYFLGAACGAGVGGQLARLVELLPLPVYFGLLGALGLAGGALLAARAGRVRALLATSEIEPSYTRR